MGSVKEISRRLIGGKWRYVVADEPENGGSQPGAIRVETLDFAYNTSGLEDGVTIFTPAVGERILDAWIEGPAAWTTDTGSALADVGTDGIFTDHTGSGLFTFALGNPIDLTSLSWEDGTGFLKPNGTATPIALAAAAATAFGQTVPVLLDATDPVLLVVSQDGQQGGDPIDGVDGTATVVVVVAGAPS